MDGTGAPWFRADVAVNGAFVVDEGRITAARPGKALLGPGAAR